MEESLKSSIGHTAEIDVNRAFRAWTKLLKECNVSCKKLGFTEW